MNQDEKIAQLKEQHDKLQEGLLPHQMAIREGIVIDVGEGAYDSYPRYGFQFFCFRSPDCVVELDRFIEHAKGKKIFFDCGAHNGLFSRVFQHLNPNGRTVAFEPMPSNWETCVMVNRGQHVMAYNCALSDRIGEMGMSSVGGHYQRASKSEPVEKVECSPGDSFIEVWGMPDIIKIDVESAELQVLKGMPQILESHPTIFLEIHCGVLSDEEKMELVKLIDWHGYLIIDCENDLPIDGKKILDQKQGELRVILK